MQLGFVFLHPDPHALPKPAGQHVRKRKRTVSVAALTRPPPQKPICSGQK
jgi:hypothetical protein